MVLNSYICRCFALNETIDRNAGNDQVNFGRVTRYWGWQSSGILKNYALNNMRVLGSTSPPAVKRIESKEGADVTAAAAKLQSTYVDAESTEWRFYATTWSDGWKMTGGSYKLPVLRW